MAPKKRAFFFISFAVLFVLIVPFIILFSLGYTFTNDYSIAERGGIYVFVSEYGADIYIDSELKKTTGTFQRELFVQNLKPKPYLVIVSNDNFYPWAKNVDVYEKEVSPLYPFLVPKEIVVREIYATSTQEYKKVSEFFAPPKVAVTATPTSVSKNIATTTATSTPESHGLLKNKMKIWSDDNEIFARWTGNITRIPPYFCPNRECDTLLKVFDAVAPIRHLDFYPDRDDAIIMSLGDGIYATEIDTRTYHNFYPLYKGENPDFRIEGGRVYVKDGKSLFELMEL